MRVVVQGNLRSRQYETREGEKRTVFEIQVDEVGPSLRYATAKVTRTQRQGGSSYGGQQGGQSSPADNDPWATPAPSSQGAPAGGGQGGAPANDPWATPGVSSDEPPF
jgi:single-strand DNA-binding protein